MLRRLLQNGLKAIAIFVLGCAVVVAVVLPATWVVRPSPDSAEGLLAKADALAWKNDWGGAFPLYGRAERLFEKKGDRGHALYSKVSQIPVTMESRNLKSLISALSNDLKSTIATEPDVRLRVLEVKARCEEEYDAGAAIQTFKQVEDLALRQHRLYLASRASGEIGILAFTLGNFEEAATRVKRAYGVAKYLGDPAAHIRLAGMIGLGLEQMGRPKQALVFLNEAIDGQKSRPNIAVPYVAIDAKIDTLADLGRYQEALGLADTAITRLHGSQYFGQLQSLFTSRSNVLLRSGKLVDAVAGYHIALDYARNLSAWRAINKIDGDLAVAYEREGNLTEALSAINDAIDANRRTPQEMFLVPGNLAFKARILTEMGRPFEAERLYAKGADIIDVMLTTVPTPEVERLLLAQLDDLYSGYFKVVSNRGRLDDAFHIIERARGRIEAQQLRFDPSSVRQSPDAEETRLQELELKFLNSDGGKEASREIFSQVVQPAVSVIKQSGLDEPAPLLSVQRQLGQDELLVEYILANPNSYCLVIRKSGVARYVLPSKKEIEAEVAQYREAIRERRNEPTLGKKLFQDVLGFIRFYPRSESLIIVADGDLHLLPFSALIDDSGRYLIESREISLAPSGTVLQLLRTRSASVAESRAYLGVAPWADSVDQRRWVLKTRGLLKSKDLTPLPQSRDEVESIGAMMPKPSTILIGAQATKAKFTSMPLSDYRILHLALHGFVDPVFPDRSSLIFAPADGDDGHLEARDIRQLKLKAELVTLSACDTAVGPVTAAGIESLDTAFIEAGAGAVVSTLWELQDSYSDTFMKNFYKHLGHEYKSAALRDAKRDLLRAGASPYDWASYELVGNPTGSPVNFGTEAQNR
jgi:CHAT domain-containing protein